MYLIYCDETNLEERSGVFFVYGGIAVSSSEIAAFSNAIDELRREKGIPEDFRLKFNPGPENLAHEEFIDLKQRIIELAIAFNCTLFSSFILHDIATSPDDARRNEINRICYHFHCFLNRVELPGIVLIDQFKDKKIDHHLREKFSVGLTGLPYSEKKRLERIVGFHYSAIGQSNMCSVVDIVLGSLRFAVNAVSSSSEATTATGVRLLELLSPLFFREQGRESVSEIGLFFSPKIVKSLKYRGQYQALHDFICRAGVNIEQQITDERTY